MDRWGVIFHSRPARRGSSPVPVPSDNLVMQGSDVTLRSPVRDVAKAPQTRIGVGRRLTKKLLAEPKKGLFYSYFYVKGVRRRRSGTGLLQVAVGPQTPKRPYLHWKLARLCGFRFTQAPDPSAELAIRFDDATWSVRENQELFPNTARIVNGGCTDISKTRVGRVFETIFGYSCELDPLTHTGDLVVKSNANAAHDGRVLTGPLAERDPRFSYQRVIDNEVAPGVVEDLRICVIGDEIPYLLRKRRPVFRRFENYTHRTDALDPKGVFSDEELRQLSAFAREFGLDLGEMDVLRDRKSGLIYVLDVNTTPHSPPDSLIGLAGIACMERAAAAFRRQFLAS
jgi:hypothetical protein